jgi:subfamily B ATP-binding cassette protein MsbA/ATP-binding cassette subfamily B protein AbcA/BmrA
VSFSYGEGPPVLQGMSFSLARGERIAIVGASGCGKSTVLKLACGDYETHTGRILVEGHDCREWDLSALRSRLSVISQDVFLFPASILENIASGRPGASREEIEAAARTANAEEFILKAPQGYETQVGERGIKLSGGQRQRIALARAILKDAPFLLLDEPTSALDTHSEALVQEAIERSLEGRTAIIVAHRLSTIKGVDRILVMDKGRVAEEGPHEALLAAGGLYAALYSRQFNSQEDMGEVPDRGGRDGE